MPKEALLRRIIPTVPPSRHEPTQITVFNQLYEFQTGIVRSLVVVDQCFPIQMKHRSSSTAGLRSPEQSSLPATRSKHKQEPALHRCQGL